MATLPFFAVPETYPQCLPPPPIHLRVAAQPPAPFWFDSFDEALPSISSHTSSLDAVSTDAPPHPKRHKARESHCPLLDSPDAISLLIIDMLVSPEQCSLADLRDTRRHLHTLGLVCHRMQAVVAKTWNRLRLKAARNLDPWLIHDVLLDTCCTGNREVANRLLDWLADILQRPWGSQCLTIRTVVMLGLDTETLQRLCSLLKGVYTPRPPQLPCVDTVRGSSFFWYTDLASVQICDRPLGIVTDDRTREHDFWQAQQMQRDNFPHMNTRLLLVVAPREGSHTGRVWTSNESASEDVLTLNVAPVATCCAPRPDVYVPAVPMQTSEMELAFRRFFMLRRVKCLARVPTPTCAGHAPVRSTREAPAT
jgi:hypothetical protein